MEQPRHRLEIGDFLVYKKLNKRGTGVLHDISNTLGYNQYHVTDLDSGRNDIVHNFEIDHVIDSRDIYTLNDISDGDEVENGIENKEGFDEQVTAAPSDVKTNRFGIVSDEDIKSLRESRFEKTTKRQTLWGLRIFRGRP